MHRSEKHEGRDINWNKIDLLGVIDDTMKLRDISDSSFQMELIPYPIFRVLCERKLKWICGQWYTVFGCIRAGKWRAREKVENDSLFFSLCREFYFSYRILEFLNHKVVDDIIKILCERKKENVQFHSNS